VTNLHAKHNILLAELKAFYITKCLYTPFADELYYML